MGLSFSASSSKSAVGSESLINAPFSAAGTNAEAIQKIVNKSAVVTVVVLRGKLKQRRRTSFN